MKNILKKTVVAVALVAALVGCERMAALANNSGQSIAYMQAQSQLMIAEAVKNGKVNTIIIPHNLTMLGSLPK